MTYAIVVACKACRSVVHYHESETRDSPLILNVLRVPCPCCGSPSMWDGWTIPGDVGGVLVEFVRALVVDDYGFAWEVPTDGGGLYQFNGEHVQWGSSPRPNFVTLRRELSRLEGSSQRTWLPPKHWMARLMRAVIERKVKG